CSSTRTPNCGRPSGRSGMPPCDGSDASACSGCSDGTLAGTELWCWPMGCGPNAEVTWSATALSTTKSKLTAEVVGSTMYFSCLRRMTSPITPNSTQMTAPITTVEPNVITISWLPDIIEISK